MRPAFHCMFLILILSICSERITGQLKDTLYEDALALSLVPEGGFKPEGKLCDLIDSNGKRFDHQSAPTINEMLKDLKVDPNRLSQFESYIWMSAILYRYRISPNFDLCVTAYTTKTGNPLRVKSFVIMPHVRENYLEFFLDSVAVDYELREGAVSRIKGKHSPPE